MYQTQSKRWVLFVIIYFPVQVEFHCLSHCGSLKGNGRLWIISCLGRREPKIYRIKNNGLTGLSSLLFIHASHYIKLNQIKSLDPPAYPTHSIPLSVLCVILCQSVTCFYCCSLSNPPRSRLLNTSIELSYLLPFTKSLHSIASHPILPLPSLPPEYTELCRAVAIGFAAMGFIGYFVKLIHIPM